MSPSLQEKVNNLIGIIKKHLAARSAELARTPQRTDDFNPRVPHEHPHEQLKFEVANLQNLIAMIEGAQSENDLISAYREAFSLKSRIIEFPRTAGEDAAGLYIFYCLRDLFHECGIHPDPMIPCPSPALKRQP